MDQHGSHHNQHPFGYGDFSSSTHQGMQSLEPSLDLMGLQAGMELLGIPSKQEQPPEASWRGMFFSKAAGTSSSGGAAAGFSQGENLIMFTPDQVQANSWQQQQQQPNPWQQQQELLRFPIERNENPTTTEGLSLALCNHEPTAFHHTEGFLSQTGPASLYQQQPQKLSSKYLFPAQELLNEFCSLDGSSSSSKHRKSNIPNKWEETSAGSSSFSSWSQSLNSLEFIELQKRKSRLLSMLEEVDRRYRKYCDQMRAVTSAFEAVAGEGAATVYSTLASKAMSRHFRCLRDGIVGQIKATKMAMGEKDPATPGSTRGETPRLRLLDQCIRQQKAFQQAGVIENHPWRPQRGLPERSVSVLRAWLFEHFLHPYPSDVDKHILARQTGLSRSQVSNWFINARVRLWKPMVEEMYVEETKEQDNDDLSHAISGHDDQTGRPGQLEPNQNPNPSPGSASLIDEQKPLMNDSESLASIINNNRHHYEGRNVNPQSFGPVDLDFSSYNNSNQSSFGNGVSLTLGLQQHNGGGMTLSFSPASQSSLFFSRETNMDECQPVVQFPIIDGDQAGQNQLPYRNMMGAQLLHDLAG